MEKIRLRMKSASKNNASKHEAQVNSFRIVNRFQYKLGLHFLRMKDKLKKKKRTMKNSLYKFFNI